MIEHAPKRRHLDGEVIVLDHYPRPHGGHHLVLRNKIASGGHEHTKHVERACTDRDSDEHLAFIPPEQTTPVEAKAPEQESIAGAERLHARLFAAARGLTPARGSRSQTRGILLHLGKFRKISSPHRCAAAHPGMPNLLCGRSSKSSSPAV
jgi:hypothetical protein